MSWIELFIGSGVVAYLIIVLALPGPKLHLAARLIAAAEGQKEFGKAYRSGVLRWSRELEQTKATVRMEVVPRNEAARAAQ